MTWLYDPGVVPAPKSSRGFLRIPMACKAVMLASRCRNSSISALCIYNNHKWKTKKSKKKQTIN